MIIRNKFTGKEAEVSYYVWERSPIYKVNSQVVEWGDIVFAQQITPENKIIDLYILDRDHICSMIENNPTLFVYRELTNKERRDLGYAATRKTVGQFPNNLTDLLSVLEQHPLIRWILLLAALISILSGILVFFI